VSLHSKVFGIAFILVIVFGVVAIAAVTEQKTPTDAAYMNGTVANLTYQNVTHWEAGATNSLSPIVLLLILFVVCTGFMTFLVISKKKK
jgi:hypothetical protein